MREHRPGLGSQPLLLRARPFDLRPTALHPTPAEPTPTACLSICGSPLLVWSPNSRSASKASGPEAPHLSSIQTLLNSGFCSLSSLHWDCPPRPVPPPPGEAFTAWFTSQRPDLGPGGRGSRPDPSSDTSPNFLQLCMFLPSRRAPGSSSDTPSTSLPGTLRRAQDPIPWAS